jgi:hypothetical protein
LKDLKTARIKAGLPKSWSQLKIDEKDLDAGTIYTGPYRGYSDEELKEIIDQEFLYPAIKSDQEYASILSNEKTVSKGKLIHFKKLDAQLRLPPGTAKKYLIEVASLYGLKPARLMENTVMFK